MGYWQGKIYDHTPEKVAEAVAFYIGLIGENHVAVGSDFDGSISTSFDSSRLALITQALHDCGVNEGQIRKVMGTNMFEHLRAQLPAD